MIVLNSSMYLNLNVNRHIPVLLLREASRGCIHLVYLSRSWECFYIYFTVCAQNRNRNYCPRFLSLSLCVVRSLIPDPSDFLLLFDVWPMVNDWLWLHVIHLNFSISIDHVWVLRPKCYPRIDFLYNYANLEQLHGPFEIHWHQTCLQSQPTRRPRDRLERAKLLYL